MTDPVTGPTAGGGAADEPDDGERLERDGGSEPAPSGVAADAPAAQPREGGSDTTA